MALSKLARSHDRDIRDVRAMMSLGLVEGSELVEALEDILDDLIRYPSLEASSFEQRVGRFVDSPLGEPDGRVKDSTD